MSIYGVLPGDREVVTINGRHYVLGTGGDWQRIAPACIIHGEGECDETCPRRPAMTCDYGCCGNTATRRDAEGRPLCHACVSLEEDR